MSRFTRTLLAAAAVFAVSVAQAVMQGEEGAGADAIQERFFQGIDWPAF